jgi:very-short-patch-repair endonuclease
MTRTDLITGQKINPEKLAEAKRLRREMTGEERILWSHLRTNRFHGLHFRRQQVVQGFIVDFYCHAARLVIEVDGPIHTDRKGYDQERDAYLEGLGLQVLRVKNEEIRRDIGGVLKLIEEIVGEG